MKKEFKSYSQLGQDMWVLEVTQQKEQGFYVEIGAVDGIELSNTYALEKYYEWSGICVEPSKQYNALVVNRRCIADNRVVYNSNGELIDFLEVTSRDSHNMFSGIKESLDDYSREGTVSQKETVTLNKLLDDHQVGEVIDYMSIDTEGSEWKILEHYNFDKRLIKLITVEHNMVEPERSEIFKLLSKQGYIRDFSADTRWDDWYYHVSCLQENPSFFLKQQNVFRNASDTKTLAAMKANN